MKSPSKSLELKLMKGKYDIAIGVDEVGMGCLAGPVVACAAYFDKKFYLNKSPQLMGINDSKLLSSKRREELVLGLIASRHFNYEISLCHPKMIDRLNIHKASKVAMGRAVKKLIRPLMNAIVLVDGLHKIPKVKEEQLTITKGDRKVFVIACASIMAKVYRDKLMVGYARKYPNYGFDVHKGYGTKNHYAQLTSFGPCDIHRKSFRLL